MHMRQSFQRSMEEVVNQHWGSHALEQRNAAKYFNVDGLILAGSALFKTELSSLIFWFVPQDKTDETARHFMQSGHKEKHLISMFVEEISQDSIKYVFAPEIALELGTKGRQQQLPGFSYGF